jgi:hypothetical protein
MESESLEIDTTNTENESWKNWFYQHKYKIIISATIVSIFIFYFFQVGPFFDNNNPEELPKELHKELPKELTKELPEIVKISNNNPNQNFNFSIDFDQSIIDQTEEIVDDFHHLLRELPFEDLSYNEEEIQSTDEFLKKCVHFNMDYEDLDYNLRALQFIIGTTMNRDIISKLMISIIDIEKGILTKEEFSELFLNEEIFSKINPPVLFQYKLTINFIINSII